MRDDGGAHIRPAAVLHCGLLKRMVGEGALDGSLRVAEKIDGCRHYGVGIRMIGTTGQHVDTSLERC